MKLVAIDDISHHPDDQSYLSLPSDEKFSAPRILSMLDNSMNTILNRSDINDGEKWTLYNQTLQRYLNHMKKTHTQHSLHNNNQSSTQDQRNRTPEAFNTRISDHNITGIFPIRDSIENITPPNVKQFFEHARQSDMNQCSPISYISLDDSIVNFDNAPETPIQQHSMPIQPKERTNKVVPKHGLKRGASKDMTTIHRHKVAPRPPRQAGNTPPRAGQRKTAKSQIDFYWKSTKAK